MNPDRTLNGIKGEHRKLIRQLLRRGWSLTITGKSHIKVTHPNGRSVVCSSTMSDRYGHQKFAADVRRIEGER